MQMGMGHPQPMATQQGQSTLPGTQVTNTQPQLAQMNSVGPLSIQLSHGGPGMPGQSPVATGAAQIMPANNSNTMFQVTTLFRHYNSTTTATTTSAGHC